MSAAPIFTAHSDQRVTVEYTAPDGTTVLRLFVVERHRRAMVREHISLDDRVMLMVPGRNFWEDRMACQGLRRNGLALHWSVDDDGPLVDLLRREWASREAQ